MVMANGQTKGYKMTTNPTIEPSTNNDWPTSARGFEQWTSDDCQIIQNTTWQAGDKQKSLEISVPEHCLLFVDGHWRADLSTLKATANVDLTPVDQHSTHLNWKKQFEHYASFIKHKKRLSCARFSQCQTHKFRFDH